MLTFTSCLQESKYHIYTSLSNLANFVFSSNLHYKKICVKVKYIYYDCKCLSNCAQTLTLLYCVNVIQNISKYNIYACLAYIYYRIKHLFLLHI